MEPLSIALKPTAEGLRGVLTPAELGLAPQALWSPSPSAHHHMEPYPLPKTLKIGLQGTEETGAKFSPPPYAAIVEAGGQRVLIAVSADAGWHRWNDMIVTAEAAKVTVDLDLEGQSDPAAVAQHVRLHVIPGQAGESRYGLLARGLEQLYPAAYRPVPAPPDWWHRPIYCGWGDQVTVSMYMEGVGPERRAVAYCLQGLYDRWIKRLDEAEVPVGTVTLDHGWSPAGVWKPDLTRWPDLKKFVDQQHQRGRRVLLWLGAWLWDALSDDLCGYFGQHKLAADATNPAYLDRVRQWVGELIGPEGFNADGFKIDQLGFCPSTRHPTGGPCFGHCPEFDPASGKLRLHGDGFGAELMHTLQKTIYDAAKQAKPDALVTSSTVHPYFHDTLDMVRLHDMGWVAPDIFETMQARADLSKAALPGKLIDTDDWVHSDYEMWMRYTSGSTRIGVPCIFYAERFMLDWKKEPATKLIPIEDLRKIGDAWRAAGF